MDFHLSRGANGSMGSPKAEDICDDVNDVNDVNDGNDGNDGVGTDNMMIMTMAKKGTLTRRKVATMAR